MVVCVVVDLIVPPSFSFSGSAIRMVASFVEWIATEDAGHNIDEMI